jgi:hypothetical protein
MLTTERMAELVEAGTAAQAPLRVAWKKVDLHIEHPAVIPVRQFLSLASVVAVHWTATLTLSVVGEVE